MSEISRSSWGIILAHPRLVFTVALAAVGAITAAAGRRASWRDERGYGLVEVAVALLVIVIAVILLAHFL